MGRASTSLTFVALALGAGGAAWYGFRPPSEGDGGIEAEGEAPSPPRPSGSSPTPESPPPPSAPSAGDRPLEGVFDPTERLAPLSAPGAEIVLTLDPDVVRGPPEISGQRVLDAVIRSRAVWVRFDDESVRTRFARATFHLPALRPIDGRPGGLLLDDLQAVARVVGYSSRLVDGVLRIGGSDAYPTTDPPAPSPR